MFRRDRPVDENFDVAEALYYRCQAQHVDGHQLLPEAIRFPNFSVNRSKYSEPEDVLIPSYHNWGIATFGVRDLPEPESTDEKTEYEWQVVHDPLEDNYAHSEVRTFKNRTYSEDLKVPTTIKKKFRQILSERIIITHQPRI
jgi:hypothetical protein